MSVLDDATLEITELPIRTWTQNYKEEVLEPMLQGTDKTPAMITLVLFQIMTSIGMFMPVLCLIHESNVWICLCNHVHLAGCFIFGLLCFCFFVLFCFLNPWVSCGSIPGIYLYQAGRPSVKNVGHYTQTVKPFFFIPAMLIGTIDFHYFLTLSLTLALPGVTRSAQSKTYWLTFLTHSSSDQDEISCGDEAVQVEHPESTFE